MARMLAANAVLRSSPAARDRAITRVVSPCSKCVLGAVTSARKVSEHADYRPDVKTTLSAKFETS